MRKHDYMVLHVDLFVRSMEVALVFYCEKLGFSIVDDALLNGPLIQRVSQGHFDALRLVLLSTSTVGAMIELQEFQPDSALTEGAQSYSLRKGWVSILVRDLRQHIATLRGHDIHPVSEIFQVTLRRTRTCEVVFYKDPDGNDLEFLQIQP